MRAVQRISAAAAHSTKLAILNGLNIRCGWRPGSRYPAGVPEEVGFRTKPELAPAFDFDQSAGG